MRRNLLVLVVPFLVTCATAKPEWPPPLTAHLDLEQISWSYSGPGEEWSIHTYGEWQNGRSVTLNGEWALFTNRHTWAQIYVWTTEVDEKRLGSQYANDASWKLLREYHDRWYESGYPSPGFLHRNPSDEYPRSLEPVTYVERAELGEEHSACRDQNPLLSAYGFSYADRDTGQRFERRALLFNLFEEDWWKYRFGNGRDYWGRVVAVHLYRSGRVLIFEARAPAAYKDETARTLTRMLHSLQQGCPR